MCDRTEFLKKYKFDELEDVLIVSYDEEKEFALKIIKKAKLRKFGTKYIYFNYYDYDKDTKIYNKKNNYTNKIYYEEITWEFYTIIKKGNPDYDKYFNEYIDETIKSDDDI